MKKQIVAILFFAITFFALPHQTLAQNVTLTPPLSPDATQSATPSAFIQYDLAFPGMLPDHPLYKLKVLRDKISVALITDPQKKVDFYLLQTDKGILASAMLIDKNNVDLAGQTALKAEHNYTLLTQQLLNFSKKPTTNYFDKLKNSSRKHQEVLQSLIKRIPEDKQETLKQVLEFSKRNQQAVEDYQSNRDITGQATPSATISPN